MNSRLRRLTAWPRAMTAGSQPQRHDDGDEERRVVLAEHDVDDDGEKDEGDAEQDIDAAHHQVVDAAAEIAGGGAIEDADENRNEGAEEAERQRYPPADEHTHEEIAPEIVGAEDMRREQVDRRRQIVEIGIVGAEGEEERTDETGESDEQKDEAADDRQVIGREAAQRGMERTEPDARRLSDIDRRGCRVTHS